MKMILTTLTTGDSEALEARPTSFSLQQHHGRLWFSR